MTYLVETDLIIDGLAGQPDAIRTFLERANEGLCISVITHGELNEGAFRLSNSEERLAIFHRYLSIFQSLPPSDGIMERFARLRATLREHGQLIPDFDLLIAATVVEHDLVLMTGNRSHFRRVKEVTLLA